jgi:lipopolysaccharide export LptBFGC system permease protein LptF
MRACGVNLLSIMKYPLLFAACCTLFGFYVNNEIVPRAHEIKNNIKVLISVDDALKLLEPGRNIDEFDGVSLFFERREGNWIYGLRATEFLKDVTREIRADKALVSAKENDIVLEMYNMTVEPIDANRPGIASFGRITHTIPDTRKQREVFRKEKDYRFKELHQAIKDLRKYEDHASMCYWKRKLSICRTLFQKRFSEAFACICFALIGVPLGIRAHRKHSTIGMGISLIVALAYYLTLILANVLQKNPSFYPHLLVWLPVAICFALAAVLIPKNL